MRFGLLALLVCVALPASAQQPPKLEPLPEVPPPPAISEQAAEEEPVVTITRRGEDRVEEFRIRGRLYMVKVTPPHGTPYYLVDNDGSGQMVRTETLEPGTSVPMWVLKRW